MARPNGKNVSSNADRIRKTKRISLPFQPKPLNLKEKIGISETSRKENRPINEISKGKLSSSSESPKLLFSTVSSKPSVKMVLAGVFRPIKFSV